MVNISLKIFKNKCYASVPKPPTQMGSLSVNNLVKNISHLGTFNVLLILKIRDINFLQSKYIMAHFKGYFERASTFLTCKLP